MSDTYTNSKGEVFRVGDRVKFEHYDDGRIIVGTIKDLKNNSKRVYVVPDNTDELSDPTNRFFNLRWGETAGGTITHWTLSGTAPTKQAVPDYRCPSCFCHLSYPENADSATDTLYVHTLYCPYCRQGGITEKAAGSPVPETSRVLVDIVKQRESPFYRELHSEEYAYNREARNKKYSQGPQENLDMRAIVWEGRWGRVATEKKEEEE